MSQDTMPVIRREWQQADSEATIEATIRDDVRHQRGLGDTGRKVQRTDKTCPCCGFEHTIRLHHYLPTERDGVTYWCLNPQCRYFVNDALSWATRPHPQMEPETPEIWSQTHICTACGSRESIEITRDGYRHKQVEDGIVKHLCDACEAEQMEADA